MRNNVVLHVFCRVARSCVDYGFWKFNFFIEIVKLWKTIYKTSFFLLVFAFFNFAKYCILFNFFQATIHLAPSSEKDQEYNHPNVK